MTLATELKCFLVTIVLLLMISVPSLVSANSTSSDHEVASNDYAGEWTSSTSGMTYNVRVEDLDRGDGMRRIVHLNPVGYASYIGISGHDYDGNSTWDRIFLCGYGKTKAGHITGCNSVIRERNSTGAYWKWEPCPADTGEADLFTDVEIAFAQSELDQAAIAIGNDSHVVQRYRWDETEQACVQVFPPRTVKTLIVPMTKK